MTSEWQCARMSQTPAAFHMATRAALPTTGRTRDLPVPFSICLLAKQRLGFPRRRRHPADLPRRGGPGAAGLTHPKRFLEKRKPLP